MADHTDMLDLIRAAVARGYCHPVNSAKEVDAYLLEAIAYEVCAALPAEGLERAREDEAKVGWTLDMELLKELRSAAGDWGYSLDLEVIEAIAIEVENRLHAQQPAAPVSGVTVREAVRVPEIAALVEAVERVIEDFDDMREAFDGLASSWSVTTWEEMDPCGPMDAWMEGERLIRAALSALEGK